jgi:hypothetical protein
MARNVRYPDGFLRRIGLRSKPVYFQKELEMFTVLSNSRNSNLYLIIALATMVVVFLAFAVVPSIAVPKPALIPVTGASEYADYYQRHPEWTINIQSSGMTTTSSFEGSDYFERHPVPSMPAVITLDTADYFTRHPELRPAVPSTDLSDYFQRH